MPPDVGTPPLAVATAALEDEADVEVEVADAEDSVEAEALELLTALLDDAALDDSVLLADADEDGAAELDATEDDAGEDADDAADVAAADEAADVAAAEDELVVVAAVELPQAARSEAAASPPAPARAPWITNRRRIGVSPLDAYTSGMVPITLSINTT